MKEHADEGRDRMGGPKRVVAIHDISCLGKCSLTVALPVISAMGIEVCPIPTAILSTHTGFPGATYRDLTDDILPVARHWQALGAGCDAVYTGYMGSLRQIDRVLEAIGTLKSPGTRVVVDPVMADDGRLYARIPPDFPAGMRKLAAAADLILPNRTEAALLLDEPFEDGPCDMDRLFALLARLAALGPRMVVLTGVWFDGDALGAAYFDAASGRAGVRLAARVEGRYHGTGDLFASVLTGALTAGAGLARAVDLATDFTARAIRRTRDAGTDPRFGVAFEAELPALARALEAQLQRTSMPESASPMDP